MLRTPAAAGRLIDGAINRLLALALLVLSLPLLVPLAVAVLLTSGFPVFYRGVRLGRHKRPFYMYKFRTLVPDAERRIGGRLLTRGDDLVTPIGWFLRDTRLDELPQLLNIVKGDMSFVGPRPERPEVYENLCRGIGIYDGRFEVRPGLVGYSQLFTPHSTPKRIRSIIDARLVSRNPRPLLDLFLVAYTAFVVLATASGRVARSLLRDLDRRRRWVNRRRLSRVAVRRTAVIVHFDDGRRCLHAPVTDISESAFVITCGERFADPLPKRFDLVMRVGRNGRSRRFTAHCRGSVAQVRRRRRGFEYVVSYEPATDRSLYVVHQRFLRRSLASVRN